jgi:hypothetical protein
MNKAFFAVPCAMGLVGIALVAVSLNAAEEFRLLGSTLERGFGFVLGGVGILGAVAVASVMRGKMKAQARRRTAESHRPRA